MKLNEMGVVVREWEVSVKLINPLTNDYTTLSTTIYHTNEAMAKTEGVKKLEGRLGITMDDHDWGYRVNASEVK